VGERCGNVPEDLDAGLASRGDRTRRVAVARTACRCLRASERCASTRPGAAACATRACAQGLHRRAGDGTTSGHRRRGRFGNTSCPCRSDKHTHAAGEDGRSPVSMDDGRAARQQRFERASGKRLRRARARLCPPRRFRRLGTFQTARRRRTAGSFFSLCCLARRGTHKSRGLQSKLCQSPAGLESRAPGRARMHAGGSDRRTLPRPAGKANSGAVAGSGRTELSHFSGAFRGPGDPGLGRAGHVRADDTGGRLSPRYRRLPK
jgi:hypothetical protein